MMILNYATHGSQFKKTRLVSKTTLFSSNFGNLSRIGIENHLLVHYNILTLRQRYADYFLMKILIGGTTAGIIASKTKKELQPYYPFFLNHLLNVSTQSWFSQHKSNDTMISSTLNEAPIFDEIYHESFIIDIFEAGLL